MRLSVDVSTWILLFPLRAFLDQVMHRISRILSGIHIHLWGLFILHRVVLLQQVEPTRMRFLVALAIKQKRNEHQPAFLNPHRTLHSCRVLGSPINFTFD
jgi:hypothetical protein